MVITFVISLIGFCEIANNEASWSGMRVGIGIAGTGIREIGCSGMGIDCGWPA